MDDLSSRTQYSELSLTFVSVFLRCAFVARLACFTAMLRFGLFEFSLSLSLSFASGILRSSEEREKVSIPN